MTRSVGALLLQLLLVGWCAAVVAQEQVIHHVEGETQIMAVRIVSYPGSASASGLGFVLVDAQNQDGRPHALQVAFASRSWTNSSVDARRALQLGPHERARFFLPLPGLSQYSFELEVAIDSTRYSQGLDAAASRGRVALLLSDRNQMTPAVLGVFQSLWPDKKTNAAQVVTCSVRDLPDDWRLLTVFDLVVVDGMSPVSREQQETLRRLVLGGGRVLVIAPDVLPAGALRSQLGGIDGVDTVRLGFGALVGAGAAAMGSSRLLAELVAGSSAAVWPLADDVQSEQRIPGLDAAPVVLFLVLILVFAIVVGPVNFYLLRKARRPLLALVTVPAIGFGTTLLMFAFAILNDGFGVRGAVCSWTVLDQVNKEASSIATRTLFAGLTPGALALGDDTLLLAPAAFERPDRRSRHRYSFDGDTGQIDGAVLPARTPTVLVSARQGVTRDRLRAQVRADGDLDLLTDGGVVPVGEMVLRDHEGGYWCGQAPKLQPVNAEQAARVGATLHRQLRVLEIEEHGGGVVSIDRVADAMLANGQDLAPGTYLTAVQQAPWVSEHGLAVDYEAARHFVVGRLGAEDFVR